MGVKLIRKRVTILQIASLWTQLSYKTFFNLLILLAHRYHLIYSQYQPMSFVNSVKPERTPPLLGDPRGSRCSNGSCTRRSHKGRGGEGGCAEQGEAATDPRWATPAFLDNQLGMSELWGNLAVLTVILGIIPF